MQLAIWTVLFSPLVQAATDRQRGYKFVVVWETNDMTRVLIAAADSALRNALKLLLRQRLPMAVVGESATTAELDADLPRLQPDLLLLDWALPEFRDPAKLATYQAAAPHARIVALSVAVEETAGVLAAGAHACLASGASPESVIGMLRKFA
jgi:DNA-binding NarL/FixJ family response regulator